MNIGIIGPSPVPFVVGGVEGLLWGLQQHLNQKTPHHAELLKLPSRERSFWELLETYEAFYRLDVSHFDMVLTTKYPAWMVQHPNHVSYVQHCLRGLYDTYHFCGEPTAFDSSIPSAKRVLDILHNPNLQGRDALERAFEALHALRAEAPNLPQDLFRFPGPFIRQILHFLDNRAMANGAVKRFYAISRTVADRTEYFPENDQVTVIHHPSFLANYPQGRYRYLFTASRLDGPKRIGLIIEAMRHVPHDVHLKIVGTGPLEAELRALAGDDPRIEFLGFVNDEGLADLYADALAVPYVPYQEDFGLITIEAMRCAKPVLTTCDSGGPNEFVVDGETGFSVMPDPKALADKINYLVENPGAAERMGRNAAERVSAITWERTVQTLLAEPKSEKVLIKTVPAKAQRPKVVVTSTFAVYPPQGGGQNRLYYLYKALANHFDVEIVSVIPAGERPFHGEIAPHVVETRVPKSERHQQAEGELERQIGTPVTDVAMPRLLALTPAYGEAMATALRGASFVVASHPYLIPAIQAHRSQIPLVYEAHNVEVDLKERALSGTRQGRELLELTRTVEAEACRDAALVLTCSERDAMRLDELFGNVRAKAVVVPNGVDLASVPFVSWSERQRLREQVTSAKGRVVVFMGSWHPPNLEAAEHIFQYAKQLPDVTFLLIGSQCSAFEGQTLPRNVALMGVVDDELKAYVLHRADLALNPMTSGSGTNLKMLDFFASGVPVLSTPFGARGLEVDDSTLFLSELDQMAQRIQALTNEELGTVSDRARKLAETHYDWHVIANALAERLTGLGAKV